MKKLLLLLLLIVLSSCASTVQVRDFAYGDPSVEKNMAKIVVMRPSIMGGAIKMEIYQGPEYIGKVGPGGYLAWEVPASQTEQILIRSNAANTKTMGIYPEAGKTYYIKQQSKPGLISVRSGLQLLDETEGIEIMKGLSMAKKK